MGAEDVVASLVHHEATFDRPRSCADITVLVLTGSRLISAHRRAPADEGIAGRARPSSTEAWIDQLQSVVVTRVMGPRPTDRHGPVELVLTLGWGAVNRLDVEPARCSTPRKPTTVTPEPPPTTTLHGSGVRSR